MKTTQSVMKALDAWVYDHPWAKGGYVPDDVVTRDHESVFPGQVNQGPLPYAIQQVRSEIAELVDVVLTNCPDFWCALEIGMGNCGGTRTIWSMIFDDVVTIEINHDLVNRFRQTEKKPIPGKFIVGSSFSPAVIEEAHKMANSCSLLFIDGDHTLEGVRADYYSYKQLVCKGGIIAFHDTVIDGPPNIMVRSLSMSSRLLA